MPNSDPLNGLPGRTHYAITSSYLRAGRIHSFAHQIESVIEQSPARVLEVGKGSGLVAAALQAVGIEVITLDMQSALEPDIVGSVTNIPTKDKIFDVCLCCQVLEHLPFDQFPVALQELRRVTKDVLVLSLPDITSCYYLKLKLPKLSKIDCVFTRPRLSSPVMPQASYDRDGHYWEIGYKGTTLTDVTRAINVSGWNLVRTWRVPEKTWHRFFLLKTARLNDNRNT